MTGTVTSRLLTVVCDEPFPASFTAATLAMPLPFEVHLWYLELDNMRSSAEDLRDMLTSEELARADRFHFEADRQRFLIGHALLRHLLAAYRGGDPRTLEIRRGVHGKPYLPDGALRFNFSDTKDAVVIGLTAGQEIGVDIETMGRSVDHAGVSEHYFTPREIAAIAAAGPDAKRMFLRYWTRKEAILKASGVGIMDDLRILNVGDARNEMRIGHAEFLRLAPDGYHVLSLDIGNDHLVAMATPDRMKDIRVMDGTGPLRSR